MEARAWLRSHLGAVQLRTVRLLLWPFIQIKLFFDALYQVVLSLIWSELTGRSQVKGLMQVSAFFLIFCGLSLLIFYLHRYEALIFSVFVTLWITDNQWARWQYFDGQKCVKISLKVTSNSCQYCITAPDKLPVCERFQPTQVRAVLITYQSIRGGVFQSEIGRLWEVAIQLRDFTCLPMYEEHNPATALRKAKKLAACLPTTDVKFAHSEGESVHAESVPHPQLIQRYGQRSLPAVAVSQTAQGWQLRTRWMHLSANLVSRQLLGRVGFLLFVLFMTEVMENFGALLHRSVMTYGDELATQMMLIETVRTVDLRPDWPDLAEAAIALGVVVLQLLELVQDRRILVTSEKIDYRLNKRLVARLSTKKVQPLLMIHAPFPMVLMLGQKDAIMLPGLTSEALLYGIWVRLIEGLNHQLNAVSESTVA